MSDQTRTAIFALLGKPYVEPHLEEPRIVARIMINELFAVMERDKVTLADLEQSRADLNEAIADMAFLLVHEFWAWRHLKQAFALIWATPGLDLIDVLQQTRMLDELDESALIEAVRKIIEANPRVVETIRKGKVVAVGSLIGQTMKAVKADPSRVRELIHQELEIPV